MTMIVTKTRADDFALRAATLAAMFGRWDSGIDYDECAPDAIVFLNATEDLKRLADAGAVLSKPRAVIEALADKHCLTLKYGRGKRTVEGFSFGAGYWSYVPLP